MVHHSDEMAAVDAFAVHIAGAASDAGGCRESTRIETTTTSTRHRAEPTARHPDQQPAVATAVPAGGDVQRIKFAEPPGGTFGRRKARRRDLGRTFHARQAGRLCAYDRCQCYRRRPAARESSGLVCIVFSREGQASQQTMGFTSWDTAKGEFVRSLAECRAVPARSLFQVRYKGASSSSTRARSGKSSR